MTPPKKEPSLGLARITAEARGSQAVLIAIMALSFVLAVAALLMINQGKIEGWVLLSLSFLLVLCVVVMWWKSQPDVDAKSQTKHELQQSLSVQVHPATGDVKLAITGDRHAVESAQVHELLFTLLTRTVAQNSLPLAKGTVGEDINDVSTFHQYSSQEANEKQTQLDECAARDKAALSQEIKGLQPSILELIDLRAHDSESPSAVGAPSTTDQSPSLEDDKL